MGVHISPTDLGAARTWAARQHLIELNCTSGVTTGQLPFSFRLGGEPSAKLLLRWKLQTSTDGNSTLCSFTTALPRADNMSIGAPLEPMQKGTDGLSFSRRFVNADVNVSCVAPRRGASLIKWKTDDHTGRPSVLFCGRGLRPQFGGPDLDYLVELHEKVSSVFSCVVHLIVFVASQALSFVLS